MANKRKRISSLAISDLVRTKVLDRDKGRCIGCDNPRTPPQPNAHIIPRSQGGLGIEENIVTLCVRCHNMWDSGNDQQRREDITKRVWTHMRSKYENWDDIPKKRDKPVCNRFITNYKKKQK